MQTSTLLAVPGFSTRPSYVTHTCSFSVWIFEQKRDCLHSNCQWAFSHSLLIDYSNCDYEVLVTVTVCYWSSLPCNLREAESLRQLNQLLKGDVWGMAFAESSFFYLIIFYYLLFLLCWNKDYVTNNVTAKKNLPTYWVLTSQWWSGLPEHYVIVLWHLLQCNFMSWPPFLLFPLPKFHISFPNWLIINPV